mmetsp:Transcript_24910/g.82846  ORF Transcript_24910/g.82846 Transcript_24910/m.82846 type:complete len:263 (+) Transcript_24910:214-1002(+)
MVAKVPVSVEDVAVVSGSHPQPIPLNKIFALNGEDEGRHLTHDRMVFVHRVVEQVQRVQHRVEGCALGRQWRRVRQELGRSDCRRHWRDARAVVCWKPWRPPTAHRVRRAEERASAFRDPHTAARGVAPEAASELTSCVARLTHEFASKVGRRHVGAGWRTVDGVGAWKYDGSGRAAAFVLGVAGQQQVMGLERHVRHRESDAHVDEARVVGDELAVPVGHGAAWRVARAPVLCRLAARAQQRRPIEAIGVIWLGVVAAQVA